MLASGSQKLESFFELSNFVLMTDPSLDFMDLFQGSAESLVELRGLVGLVHKNWIFLRGSEFHHCANSDCQVCIDVSQKKFRIMIETTNRLL